jgi:hypothetical protein
VVAFVGDLRIDCTAVDISAVGIGMRGPRLATAGQFLRINFCLHTDTGVPRWFDADGVVARAVLRGDHYEFGVQFIVVEDRVAKEIHTYVTSTQRAAQLQAQATEWPNDGLPDAVHPPKRTGEFDPSGSANDKRRTAEYGEKAVAGSRSPSSTTSSVASGTIDTRRPTSEQRRVGTNPPVPSSSRTNPPAPSSSRTNPPAPSSSRTSPPVGSTTRRTTPPGIPTASSPNATPQRPAPREAPVAPLEDLVPNTDLRALYRAALSEVNGRHDGKKKR